MWDVEAATLALTAPRIGIDLIYIFNDNECID